MKLQFFTQLVNQIHSLEYLISTYLFPKLKTIQEKIIDGIKGKVVYSDRLQLHPDYWRSHPSDRLEEITELRLSLANLETQLLQMKILLHELKINGEKQTKLYKRLFFIIIASVMGLNSLLFGVNLNSNAPTPISHKPDAIELDL